MFKCEKCQKEFKARVGLVGHSRSHAKDAPVAPVVADSISLDQPKIISTSSTPVIIRTTADLANYNKMISVSTSVDYTKYKNLPPPVVTHLEKTFGNWLNYFDIGQVYGEDFGGYAMYIIVPPEFSAENRTATTTIYAERKDGEARPAKLSETTVKIPDVRVKSLKDTAETNKWINLVKDNIIKSAYQKGIQLPNTNTASDETKKTMDDYRKSLHT